MSETKPGSAVLETIRGKLYWPESQEYEQARVVFNAMFDRRPALIVRCAAPSDVACALAYARDAGLEVTVYGGGHGVTASAVVDHAVCIDLRGMRRIEVDPHARVARVHAGCTWAELDAATQQHGLAVTGGRVGSTGVVGLALGSGSGWLERSLGFTCDNLLAAELVTVDGREVTASPEVNPELFWGIRGGGGNFGVVTRLTLQLHPVGPLVLGGMLMYPVDQAFDVASNWARFMQDAPDQVNGCVAFITAPPLDFVPEALRGRPVVGVVVCYHGDVEEGRRVFAPVLRFGSPGVNMVQPMPYLAVQSLIEAGNPPGLRNYWSADLYGDLPEKRCGRCADTRRSPCLRSAR
jgi:FAD/FMN-containing dehydrogenase